MGTRIFAVTLTGVFMSVNNGATWTADTTVPTDINCIVSVNNKFFAGTDSSGVFMSTDSGVTFSAFGSGIPAGTRVWSLTASSDSSNIYAGTSSGVWRFSLFANGVRNPQPLSGPAHQAWAGIQIRRQSGARMTSRRIVIKAFNSANQSLNSDIVGEETRICPVRVR